MDKQKPGKTPSDKFGHLFKNQQIFTAKMSELEQAWAKASGHLKERLGEITFDTWITPLKANTKDNNLLILEAPDTFFKEWVDKHYRSLIEESLAWAGAKISFSLAVGHHTAPKEISRPTHVAAKGVELLSSVNLNPRYTFENFVVGSSNKAALAYCQAVADSPAKAYNPLFIYGGVGLGKTHLMQAVCHHIKNKNEGSARICYITSEKFTNELIEAIQHHSTNAFRQKYRNNVDVLVIDDIQFIAGKESTQEEFFHTFNALFDSHKQIILSSDRPPKEIANLQDRLVSRFSWGLSTDIQPPDLETRIAILKKKIEREPVPVPDDVIYFIAQLIKTNIRELEGALIRTIANSLLEEKPVNLESTKEVLKDLLKEPKKLITVDFIQRCVAEEFGLSLPELRTKRRNKTVVVPRQVAMYLSRELTELSLPEIGHYFGGKDHTTVLHSYNKIKEEVSKNAGLKNKLEKIIQVIQQ